ncbi:MAG: oxidoreductase, partial [Bacteroidota bacterium]
KQGFKTPEQGCSTTLWAATTELLADKPGVYCEDCNIAAPTDMNSPTARYFGANPQAYNDESAEKLWEISEALLAKA